MSLEAAKAFRDKIGQIPALQEQVRAAIASGTDLSQAVKLGKQYGCAFTVEEAAAVLQNVNAGDELSDFELEMVAGGKSRGNVSPYQVGIGSISSAAAPPPRRQGVW